MPDDDEELLRRIRARSRRLWEEEGRPEGRAKHHWAQACLIVALEDTQHTMLMPVQPDRSEQKGS